MLAFILAGELYICQLHLPIWNPISWWAGVELLRGLFHSLCGYGDSSGHLCEWVQSLRALACAGEQRDQCRLERDLRGAVEQSPATHFL